RLSTPSYYTVFYLQSSAPNLYLHSFPTRRSSDLFHLCGLLLVSVLRRGGLGKIPKRVHLLRRIHGHVRLTNLVGGNRVVGGECEDRKSTRLNSSHRTISYAVFCLKKKNN